MPALTPSHPQIAIYAASSMAVAAPLHIGGNATTTMMAQEWAVLGYTMLDEEDLDCADAVVAMNETGGITLDELKAKSDREPWRTRFASSLVLKKNTPS